ncbi:MAG: Ig-like domain-containing protein [Solirubrobacterales bacterium]
MRFHKVRTPIALAVISAFLAIVPVASAADGDVVFYPSAATTIYLPSAPTLTWAGFGAISSADCALARISPSPATLFSPAACSPAGNGPTVDTTAAPTQTSYTWNTSPMISADGHYRATYSPDFVSAPDVIATRDFVIDTVSPVVTANAPTGVTNDNTPQISYLSQDTNLDRTECAVDPVDPLDPAEYSVCPASPFSLPALADGEHKIYVVAYDKIERLSATVKVFTVDATGPAINLTGLSEGEVLTSAWPPISVSSNDPGTGVMNTTCAYDSTAPAECSDSVFLNTPLMDGPHTLNIVATDVAGNVSTRTIHFTIDTSGGLKQGLIAPKTAKFAVKRGKLSGSKYATTFTVSFAMPAGSTATSCSGSAKISAVVKKKQIGSASAKFKQSGSKCVATAKTKLSKKFKGKKLALTIAYKSGPIKAFTLRGSGKL